MIVFGISRKELKIFLERSLSERERQLLLDLSGFQGSTFSSIVAELSDRYPESTVKLILKRLKYFNLIDFGSLKDKGKPLTFTSLGRIFSEILRDE